MELTLMQLGTMTSSVLLGAMLFFSGLVAPVVFIKLEIETAGRLIRALFPHYYMVIIVLGFAAAGFLAGSLPAAATILAAIAALGVFTRQSLMPRINAYRDSELAGDEKAAAVFNRLHRLSVWINGAQILALMATLAYCMNTLATA